MIDPSISLTSADVSTSGQPEIDADAAAVVLVKLGDADGTTYQPEFSPEEADIAGAFVEDALSEDDAREAGAAPYPPISSVDPAVT